MAGQAFSFGVGTLSLSDTRTDQAAVDYQSAAWLRVFQPKQQTTSTFTSTHLCSLAMASSKDISIYAELLSNIRQVSVVASLSSPPDSSTKAEISHEGRRLQVTHQGQTESISLPAQVALTAAPQVATNGRPALSWRLPLSPAEARPAPFSLENQALPWTSADIEAGSRIGCRNCDNEFVTENAIKAWKDLPSENWAEMMEFWHCHKPHDHDQQDPESLANKGYGASHAISAQSGIGFVDLTSFLFSESDCKGVKVSGDSDTTAFCSTLDLACIRSQPLDWGERRCPCRCTQPFSDLAIDTTPRDECTVVPTRWAGNLWETFFAERVPCVT